MTNFPMSDGAVPTAADRLAAAERRGLRLPPSPTPQGDYRPALIHSGLIYTSGMGTVLDGVRRHVGYVGADISVEQAQEAATIATMNAVAAAVEAAGGAEAIERVLKLTGFVRSSEGFTDQARVLDAASRRLVELFGTWGVHARSAIGVAELPFGIPVEVELVLAHHGTSA